MTMMFDSNLSTSRLTDLSWELGVTAASSDLGQVGQPYVRLLMKLVTGENSLEDFVVELNLQQFYSLLHQLEATHNKLQQNNTI